MKPSKLPVLTCPDHRPTLLNTPSCVHLPGGVQKPKLVRWQLPCLITRSPATLDLVAWSKMAAHPCEGGVTTTHVCQPK